MRTLGIDPGLARVGFGIIDTIKDKQTMLDCGIIRTDKNLNDGDRMFEIFNDLTEIITKWEPQVAVVEKFFFYRSSTTISVVQARGVLIMTLAKMKIPIVEYAPMQIKLAVAGSGKASKSEVLGAVMHALNLEKPPRPDDAADALAIALTYIYTK